MISAPIRQSPATLHGSHAAPRLVGAGAASGTSASSFESSICDIGQAMFTVLIRQRRSSRRTPAVSAPAASPVGFFRHDRVHGL